MQMLTVVIRGKWYAGVGHAPAHRALADFRVVLPVGEFAALVGPSGCGKTTLLNIVAGLDTAFDGEIHLPIRPDGTPARIGYVFQTPRLLPWRTVYENVALVLSPDEDPAIVDELLCGMDLFEARHVYPPRLSLGMSRRVAIARAFAVQPDLLLMDEPFVSLDGATADRLRNELLKLWRQRPTSVLFVTHDLREAVFLADRLLFLSGAPGRVLTEMRVPLSRDRRADPRAIDMLCDEIARRYQQLLAAADVPPVGPDR